MWEMTLSDRSSGRREPGLTMISTGSLKGMIARWNPQRKLRKWTVLALTPESSLKREGSLDLADRNRGDERQAPGPLEVSANSKVSPKTGFSLINHSNELSFTNSFVTQKGGEQSDVRQNIAVKFFSPQKRSTKIEPLN